MAVMGEFSFVDKIILITGGCKGIGLETARRISSGGGTLILTTRDEDLVNPGTPKQQFISGFQNPSKTHVHKLDLASLHAVFEFCDKLKTQFSRIDCIICNAGVMSKTGGLTREGWEMHFGVNYLAHFYLVLLLTKSLTAAKNPSGSENYSCVFQTNKER